jgi:hypothetical protein
VERGAHETESEEAIDEGADGEHAGPSAMVLDVQRVAGVHRVVASGDGLHEHESPSDDEGEDVDEPHKGSREYVTFGGGVRNVVAARIPVTLLTSGRNGRGGRSSNS